MRRAVWATALMAGHPAPVQARAPQSQGPAAAAAGPERSWWKTLLPLAVLRLVSTPSVNLLFLIAFPGRLELNFPQFRRLISSLRNSLGVLQIRGTTTTALQHKPRNLSFSVVKRCARELYLRPGSPPNFLHTSPRVTSQLPCPKHAWLQTIEPAQCFLVVVLVFLQ